MLGRPPSEKKWAYPVPTGSPMFERVRTRNHDQDQDEPRAAASNADPSQPMLPPAQAEAAGARGQEQQTGLAERSAYAVSACSLLLLHQKGLKVRYATWLNCDAVGVPRMHVADCQVVVYGSRHLCSSSLQAHAAQMQSSYNDCILQVSS